ncbi:hypothetical protein SAMN04488030_0905 [Aliiroseovarius halocynthiae]|nr:hypothetical protein SAMN04488030_0905 [Aliiroseovarius halocynthiae]
MRWTPAGALDANKNKLCRTKSMTGDTTTPTLESGQKFLQNLMNGTISRNNATHRHIQSLPIENSCARWNIFPNAET